MKTFLLAFIILIGIVVISCSSNDTTNPTKPLDKNLLGTWAMSEIINIDTFNITMNILDDNSEYGGDVNLYSVVYSKESSSTIRVETTLKGTLSLEYIYPNIKIKRGIDTAYFFSGILDSLTKKMTGKIISFDKNVTLTKQ
jgi:hypothetical protein